MPTRAQKAAMEQAESKTRASTEPRSQHGKHNLSASGPSSPFTTTTQHGAMETIGGRLRKRRRTGSTPPADSSSAPVRSQSKTMSSPIEHSGQPSAPLGAIVQDAQNFTTEVLGSPKLRNRSRSSNTAISGAPGIQQQSSPGFFPAHGGAAPDFSTVIADIINHGETVDNHYATQRYDITPAMDTGTFHHLGANFNLKLQSLPVLENLATQILEIMAKSTYHEILTIATKADTDPGQAYATLKSLFDHTKKVYSVQEPFLNPYQLGLSQTTQIDIIRKSNMATFVSSVFGSQDVGFYHLNENFLDTFAADGNRLLKSQAQLLLELKTQAYISAVQNTDRSREEILQDLFPNDLGDRLLKRRPGAKQLAPSELDFVQRARNRRKALLEEATNSLEIAKLPDKYVWEDFLRDVSTYVSKNFDAIAGTASVRSSNAMSPNQRQPRQNCERWPNPHQTFSHTDLQMQATQLHDTQNGLIYSTQAPFSQAAFSLMHEDGNNNAGKEAQAAYPATQTVSNDHSIENHPQPPQTLSEAQPLTRPQIQYHFEHPLHPNVPAPPPPYFQHIPYQQSPQMQQQWNGDLSNLGQLHPSYSNQQVIPYPTQSAPTQILYERARMAATAKASPNNRRAAHPSQRRPWTTEEESSLMAGLDRVKGPHWSQILAMFGPGGTINEILKDRNQVQLKDKARNLKLFFLKSGIEVPYYLQFVTGELKTRAPAQAAKNEAKQKGTTEEDRAHVEGLMALAAGSSHEGDHVMTGFEGPQPSVLRHGHVPMADMGVGPRPNGENGFDVPIDPVVSHGTTHLLGGSIMDADAATNKTIQMSVAKPEHTKQQS